MSHPVPGGRVYVVGAGPGDPGLLTVRAAEVLAVADSIFHDRLVSPEVLGTARGDAVLVDVGHRSGLRKRVITEVVAEMAGRARAGEVVCRLKGGDPFVFGRGAEDLQALVAEGVRFELVPGVSSALAGPAAAGIPVSHRGVATSILIVTGHESDPGRGLDWSRLRADTVVVLMGGGRLATIVGEMLGAGWDQSTPAAVVMAATTPRQAQVVGQLGEIEARARDARLDAPSLLVVGAVVELASILGGPSPAARRP